MKTTKKSKWAGWTADKVNGPRIRTLSRNFVIGIDADTDTGNGLAVWCNKERKFIFYGSYSLRQLLCHVESNYDADQTVIYVDAGWLNKGFHHGDGLPEGFSEWKTESKLSYAAECGKRVGINLGVGKAICNYLKEAGFIVHEYQPTTAKWSAEDLRRYTGIRSRTNQDVRDAIKIAFSNK